MEIVQERLEREFNLDLIATAPSVVYHAYLSDGSMMEIRNPPTCPTATAWIGWRSRGLRPPSFACPNSWGGVDPVHRAARGAG
jgi:hypothetical protein